MIKRRQTITTKNIHQLKKRAFLIETTAGEYSFLRIFHGDGRTQFLSSDGRWNTSFLSSDNSETTLAKFKRILERSTQTSVLVELF